MVLKSFHEVACSLTMLTCNHIYIQSPEDNEQVVRHRTSWNPNLGLKFKRGSEELFVYSIETREDYDWNVTVEVNGYIECCADELVFIEE